MTSAHHKKYSFLVDVNLPKKFSFFNYPNFEHVVDLDPIMTDRNIWDYAINENKVILTKDTDFYEMSMTSEYKPKIIFFQFGNITLKELHNFFEINWNSILAHLDDADFIVVNKEKIKVIF